MAGELPVTAGEGPRGVRAEIRPRRGGSCDVGSLAGMVSDMLWTTRVDHEYTIERDCFEAGTVWWLSARSTVQMGDSGSCSDGVPRRRQRSQQRAVSNPCGRRRKHGL